MEFLKLFTSSSSSSKHHHQNYQQQNHNVVVVDKQPIEPIELNEEEYCLFILTTLFNAHYLPWLKDQTPTDYFQNFVERFNSFSQNIDQAFPQMHYNRKKFAINLANKCCFKIARKLLISIESVKTTTTKTIDDGNDNNDDQHDFAVQSNYDQQQSSSFWLEINNILKIPIEIESNFQSSIEIPNELNLNKMIIKGFQQQKYRQEEDLPKLFLEVNDYEISGYAGYTKTITLDNLKFHLNLRWELERNFILNFVQKPEIFLKFFTGCILALGTYFYTFYSNLYAGLLLQESTQKQALKCFPEVAFMIGSTQRSKLSSEFLIIFRQFQTNMIEQQQQCNQETCSMVYNLINAVLILLDNVNLIEIELFRCLLIEPFNHIIRFNCDPMIVCSRNFRLHKLLIGRLYKLLKNSDHPILQEKCFEHILLNLLFDTTEFKLEQMQKESIMLFARYCKVKNIFIDNDGNAEEDDNKIKEKTSVNRSDEGDIHQNKHHYQQKHKLRKYSNEKLLPNTQQQDGSSSSNDVKIEKFRDLLFKYWPETFEQNQQQLDRVLSDLISPLVEYGFPIIS